MTSQAMEAPGSSGCADARGETSEAPRLSTRSGFVRVGLAIALGLAGLGACADEVSPPVSLDAEALKDPATCQHCHRDEYAAWSGSMHAYSAQDPVFLAMNARGQRETQGALGSFCVNCHAPVALREGLTQDGLNLASVPAAKKGVTCYFCHSVASVQGTHDNPLVLTSDGTLFGPFANPVASPHKAKGSQHFNETSADSAALCGSCHDIVTPLGAHLERTYGEWQSTLFAVPPKGLPCASCHMPGKDGVGSAVSSTPRRQHSHAFAGIDVALEPTFPRQDEQAAAIQELLDASLQSTICYETATRTFQVVLDNVGAGHGFPSGSSVDRRVWVELDAQAQGVSLFSTGKGRGTSLVDGSDPELWLLRDCLFDGAGRERHMFWEAATVTTNQLPGSVVMTVNDPSSFSRTHVARTFPSRGALPMAPDRIDLVVHVQPVGDDVLEDLVASGDLAVDVAARMKAFEVGGAALTWTAADATRTLDPKSGAERLCVTTGRVPLQTVTGATFATCQAP